MSVNINPSDLDSEKFRDKLLGLISEYNIPYKTILLEITERQGGDFEGMKIHIDKYKNHGVRFAIDDFGTGYSNLNLVTALDVDEIKIDKSLTREGANKQVISSQADSLIKISRIWADFFPANTSNQPI